MSKILKGEKLKGWTQSQIRFHLKRAGNVSSFCEGVNMNRRTLYRYYAPNQSDDLHNGRMVSIGGILVKRCSSCEVTRSVTEFYGDEARKDGIRSRCILCVEMEKESIY